MTGRIRSITLAHYDFTRDPWRARYGDRPGVRVRVYYRGYRNSALGRRDYYPSRAALRVIQELVWTHDFMGFRAKGQNRIAIYSPNVLPNKE